MGASQQLLMASGAAVAATDPYFASVVSLLHFNGTDASTTFTDQIGARTWTANGNAQLDTAQKKFGTAAYQGDGTTDYITCPDHADWEMGTGDFTIEMFIRLFTTTQNGILILKTTAGSVGPYQIQFFNNNLYFVCSSSSVTATFSSGAVDNLSVSTWYHVAMTRESGTVRCYRDGVHLASGTVAGSLVDNSDVVSVGATQTGTVSFNGWIDDFRVTKGVARYTGAGSFTPPASEFPDS